MTAVLADIPLEPAGVPRGRAMVERAEWAALSFASYDIESVRRIAKAAAEAGERIAGGLGEAAVAETGFGVAEHKKLKNVACSIGIWNTYGDHDYVTPTVHADRGIVEVPRPAGVVLALTPSTNPVATVLSFLCSATPKPVSATAASPSPPAICSPASAAALAMRRTDSMS